MTVLHKRVLLFLVFMCSVALVNFPVFGEKLNGTVIRQEQAFQLIKMKGPLMRNYEEFEEEETGEEEVEQKIFRFDSDLSIFDWNLGTK